jgi:hypothetical protein
MKPWIILVTAALVFPTAAKPFDAQFRAEFPYKTQEAWEEKGPQAIKRFSSKVLDTMWGRRGSLWLEVRRGDTDWNMLDNISARRCVEPGNLKK